mmetsp:Transcript_2011/g.3071  ORF Transcript_2011/g.3071 Transcript_2011/m.3071 type:complete len:84 (-) Transcript_2011:512-763(-)|eukprot:CAMPEP_0184342946 /NCGR_PEP_ID=MMETSP1089-20130417/11506_1 /TAXON_ID=38269 ORGANISM="Gloeochaete wittrockiana, Strain SAG46.84" /NCGR_SAMPLE_ID=MMETSP1089 /ASSEMBLY_ACC=CAM_ASM_000445 /LENGTH=83 /DNA_ID=CAMNT_0026672037 /DNA_START=26 /DNA_END=277 /DNA_ORIENTATION=-
MVETVRVLFFARSRELTGVREANVDLQPGSDSSALLEEIKRRYPQLSDLLQFAAFAVNLDYISKPTVLKHGDEFAVIPPISGG